MAGEYDCCGCKGESAQEKRYPVSRLGLILLAVGLALVLLSLIFGFWLAVLGAVLIAVGYIVVMSG